MSPNEFGKGSQILADKYLLSSKSKHWGSIGTEDDHSTQLVKEQSKVIDSLKKELTLNIRELEEAKEKFQHERQELIDAYEAKID